MEELFTFIKEGQVMIEIMLIVVTAIITFLFGRYTSYLDDRRTGMKDINNSFYKLFLSTYKNEHHAYALFFVDLEYATQKELMKILLENSDRVSPAVKLRINDLDQCFSGYSKDIENGREISDEEKKYVENGFHHIYNYIERQYIKNERKLYCSIPKRIFYKIQDVLISCRILKII